MEKRDDLIKKLELTRYYLEVLKKEMNEKIDLSMGIVNAYIEVYEDGKQPDSDAELVKTLDLPNEVGEMVMDMANMSVKMFKTIHDLSAVDDMDLPSNVAVLKQLITKLPANVSKQTGALIIRQTMEALGISMNSVLNEAQQVQENLNNSALECQNSIVEYKKQINILEAQTQKFQRQYAAVNDIISLFVQTN